MTIYTISYDLRNESGTADYKPLWTELNRLDAHRTQDSVWLASINATATELHNHMKKFIDSDDRLMVDEFKANNHYSNARFGTIAWLKKNSMS